MTEKRSPGPAAAARLEKATVFPAGPRRGCGGIGGRGAKDRREGFESASPQRMPAAKAPENGPAGCVLP